MASDVLTFLSLMLTFVGLCYGLYCTIQWNCYKDRLTVKPLREMSAGADVTIEERHIVDGGREQDVVCLRFSLADGTVQETWCAVEDIHALTRFWIQRHPILARTGGRETHAHANGPTR